MDERPSVARDRSDNTADTDLLKDIANREASGMRYPRAAMTGAKL